MTTRIRLQTPQFDQPFERGDETRVGFRYRPTPASGAANPPLRKRLAIEVVFAAIDRRTSEPGNLRHQRETATTSAPHLRRRKQPPTTLVKPRADRLPSQLNCRLVDHAIELRPFATSRNPQHLIIPTQDDDPSRFDGGPPQLAFVEIGEATDVYEYSVLVTSLNEDTEVFGQLIRTGATERMFSTR